METSTKSCEAELLQTLRKNSTFQFRIILRHFFQPSVRLSKTSHHRIHEGCCSCTVSWLQPGRHQDSVTGHDPPDCGSWHENGQMSVSQKQKNFTKWLLAVWSADCQSLHTCTSIWPTTAALSSDNLPLHVYFKLQHCRMHWQNWSFLCSVISQGKVVALDRWGGKWNQLSMTHRLTSNYAKNYCNRTLIVKVIVEDVVTCFLGGHGVVWLTCEYWLA